MIAFNHVVPVLNLSVFNVRRAPAFAFEQSKRATIGGRALLQIVGGDKLIIPFC
uniref:TrbB n=1 Tax=Escherichia coli TaxID=562 RepID=A0A6G6ARY1_ECOLX|nr:TrbB [Escherichia coli]